MRKMKCQSGGSLALGFLGFKILFKNHQIFPAFPEAPLILDLQSPRPQKLAF
jgi:hypothetical protein